MVFTSIPAYLDPANWHQQQQPNHHTGSVAVGSSGGSQHQNQQQHLLSSPPPPPLPPPTQAQGVGSSGSIRPGSMADRARMANIPLPEAALKCPRCESTNTKFCYFNNYSLSQPRHFCKTCRRYWTRGGALRNVPVGGGCRRNKRSSKGSSRSKSPVSSDRQTGSASSTNSASSTGDIVGLAAPHAPPLRFMSPLLTDYSAGGELGGLNYGLNYNTISSSMGGVGGVGDLNFSALSGGGSGSTGTGTGTAAAGSILFAAGLEQWRMPQAQQFPFLAGLEAPPGGLYPFEGGASAAEGPEYGAGRGKLSTSGVITQLASVKMEDHNQGLNLSRQFMGLNEQYWSNIGGGSGTTSSAWTDLSGFSSSSATSNNPL